MQLRQIHFATVTHAVSQPGLDLGGSFGRFYVARRFGRKLQTPFIGFGKGQSHELLGRLERPSDRGRPRMRNRPPSLAIQVLAESTKEGAEDSFKPMAAWIPLFLSNSAPARYFQIKVVVLGGEVLITGLLRRSGVACYLWIAYWDGVSLLYKPM